MFSDTMTGTTFEGRSELDKAFKVCENLRGEVNYLLTYKMDRFGRDVADAIHAVKKFRSIGVEVNFSDEWIQYKDTSHPLVMAMKFGLAESESLKISERTKDGIYQSQLNGYYPFNAPPGYKKQMLDIQLASGAHQKICVPNPDTAPHVKAAFDLLASGGHSQAELYRQLGKKIGISRTRFYKMFHNTFYCGQINVKAHKENTGKIIKGKHEPIVPTALFEKCQDLLNKQEGTNKGHTWVINNTLSDSDYYLKGILRCAYTDRFMTAYQVKKKSGKRYSYYATASGPRKRQVRADRAHTLMCKAINDLTVTSEMYKLLREELDAESKERSKDLVRLINKSKGYLTTEKNRLGRITDDYADGNIDGPTFTRLHEKILSKIVNLEAQLAECQEQLKNAKTMTYKIMGMLKDVNKMFGQFGHKQKNQFLRAAFPDGLYIDEEYENYLTPKTNIIFELMGCRSDNYKYIKIMGDSRNDENPPGGGRADENLTFRLRELDLWIPFMQAI